MKTYLPSTLTARHLAFVGVPCDEGSSFMRGPAAAPDAVRRALASPSANWATEAGRDLATDPRLVDAGDLRITPGGGFVEGIASGMATILATGARVIACGGDHAVTYPLVQAHAAVHGPLSILHLDAHSDTYDEFEGNRLSHACPFARIMEAGLARRLVQVGIRTLTPHQRAQTERFGIEVIPMAAWPAGAISLEGPVYLSLDLDVMDPAFVPGVSHHEPGGASVRDVVRVIQQVRGRLVGADVVELNPSRDLQGVTAMVAAKCVKEIAERMLE